MITVFDMGQDVRQASDGTWRAARMETKSNLYG